MRIVGRERMEGEELEKTTTTGRQFAVLGRAARLPTNVLDWWVFRGPDLVELASKFLCCCDKVPFFIRHALSSFLNIFVLNIEAFKSHKSAMDVRGY